MTYCRGFGYLFLCFHFLKIEFKKNILYNNKIDTFDSTEKIGYRCFTEAALQCLFTAVIPLL